MQSYEVHKDCLTTALNEVNLWQPIYFETLLNQFQQPSNGDLLPQQVQLFKKTLIAKVGI